MYDSPFIVWKLVLDPGDGAAMTTDEVKIRTNNHPRDIIDAWALTDKERDQFDYYDWNAILEEGTSSAKFFRYRGEMYDLGEVMTTSGMPEFSPLKKWDGYQADTFFSGLVVKYVENFERVIVGRFTS